MATRGMYLLIALTLTIAATSACSPGGKARTPDWKRTPVSLELRLAKGAPASGLVPPSGSAGVQ
jgi:hypothetical protein